VKSISEAFFIKLFEFTGKSSADNYKQYRKLIQGYRKVAKEVIISTFYLKLQLLSATRQDSGEFIFRQIAAARKTRQFYDINISQGSVATRLR